MPDLTADINRLALSGDELSQLTGWDDAMVTDYLGIHESLLLVATAFDGLITFSAKPTEDSGDGTIEGDVNATDWTGHDKANGTRLQVLETNNVIFGHKGTAYQYVGDKPALLGIGGDYTTVNSDFIPIGAGDHDVLNNRSLPDAHPISAITNLQPALDLKADQTALDAHTGDGSIHFAEASIDHNNIQNIGTDTHDQLEARLDLLESTIIELVPSGYGGMSVDPPQSFDIVGAYTTVPFNTNNPLASRGLTINLTNDTVTFTTPGVWLFTFLFNIAGHNSSNGGRNYNIRIWNVTLGQVFGKSVQEGIGRNETYTVASFSVQVEVSQISVDDSHEYRIEVGGGDSATGGTLNLAIAQFSFVSELGLLV